MRSLCVAVCVALLVMALLAQHADAHCRRRPRPRPRHNHNKHNNNNQRKIPSMCRSVRPVSCACKNGLYKLDDQRCFKMYYFTKTFAQAEAFCKRRGGELMSMHDLNQYKAVRCTMYRRFRKRVSFWLGGKRQGKTFVWTDKSPFNYARWSRGQPNNLFRRQNCLELTNSGRWNDTFCHNRRRFICSMVCPK